MKKSLLLAIPALAFLGGCVQVPPTVNYNGHLVTTVSPLSADCDTPYAMDEDCGSIMGAKRVIEIDGVRVRIAGGEEGSAVMIMADSNLSLRGEDINRAAIAIEDMLTEKGFTLLETIVCPIRDEFCILYFKFDGDVYSIIKDLTVED